MMVLIWRQFAAAAVLLVLTAGCAGAVISPTQSSSMTALPTTTHASPTTTDASPTAPQTPAPTHDELLPCDTGCNYTPGPSPPPLTPRPTREVAIDKFVLTRVGDDVYWQDPFGRAVYTRDADPPGKSRCYDECALLWPPVVLLAGEVPAVKPASIGKVGSIVRDDGSIQMTFKGKPLYYYSADTEPALANGMCEEGWSMITPYLVEPLCG